MPHSFMGMWRFNDLMPHPFMGMWRPFDVPGQIMEVLTRIEASQPIALAKSAGFSTVTRKFLTFMFYPSLYGVGLSNLSTSLEAGQARADAKEAQTGVELMQHDIERLLMITEVLWLFIKTQHNYTDEDLVKVITEIEMRDSQLPKHQPVTCPACGRVNSGKRDLCIYCGKPIPMDPFAR